MALSQSASAEPPIPYPASNLSEDSYDPGSDWKLVWADEFSGKRIDPENWTFQVLPAGHFNEEWQRYTDSPGNAYIDQGCLVIKAIHESEAHGENQYTSARLHTGNKRSFKYGKIAARIQLPHGKGMWPAFWMLGANCTEVGGDTAWPFCGEIDILELYGSKDDGVVEANIHYAGEDNAHAMLEAPRFKLEAAKFAHNFHVFELIWDAEHIEWRVDGAPYASVPITSPSRSEFHQEFYLLLNIAVGGTWAGRPDESTQFPQMMYVDWIRVYEQES
jgi:beta-glucanase (GH16 family)